MTDKENPDFAAPSSARVVLPVLPLPEVVIFPNAVSPLLVARPHSIAAVEEAVAGGQTNRILLVTQKTMDTENPTAADLYLVGTISQILQLQRAPDGTIKSFIEGQEVARVIRFIQDEKILRAEVEPVVYVRRDNKRLLALRRAVLSQFESYARLSEKIPEEMVTNIKGLDDPLQLCHMIANYAAFKTADKQALLEMEDISEKLLFLSRIFSSENELLAMERKILNQVRSQIGKNQKEYFLNEQLKVIEKELGLSNEEDAELEELQKAIDESKMSDEAREKAERELSRLSRMAPMSPESTVSRTYIEWLLDFPWEIRSEDNLDLERAEKVLNDDHFGLEKVKERILEYLAVHRMLKKKMKGPILCLVGPPGVGKTSLARSIARTLDRKFVRFSLGGVRDEAEIRGHRRTYVGALPGKIVQMMKKAGSVNPVMLLDEIDKMSADFRGDPASALLEVLDPEQNVNFNDHYMEIDLNLSETMFITTANTTDGIPWALQDRMEILRLSGYTRLEKLEIAKRFLVPRQIEAHGLDPAKILFSDNALETIIDFYTREAGVRNLEREIASLCRKVARKLSSVSSRKKSITLMPKDVRAMLGPVHFKDAEVELTPQVGSATGMAWTEVGGELLVVEATVMPGKGTLQLTGKLGEVMRESAQAAVSYIRAHADDLGIPADFHEKKDIHVHLPEGAIPKDGPSAGVALVTAIVSALSGRKVRRDVAMTGEITLRGMVLKIGGLKEKVIAAHRAHIPTVIIPSDNEDDLTEIAQVVREEIKFIQVKTIDDVLKITLVPEEKQEDKGTKGSVEEAKVPEVAEKAVRRRRPPARHVTI